MIIPSIWKNKTCSKPPTRKWHIFKIFIPTRLGSEAANWNSMEIEAAQNKDVIKQTHHAFLGIEDGF